MQASIAPCWAGVTLGLVLLGCGAGPIAVGSETSGESGGDTGSSSDGDGEPGDGDPGDGDGDPGDGDGEPGDGDGDPGDGDEFIPDGAPIDDDCHAQTMVPECQGEDCPIVYDVELTCDVGNHLRLHQLGLSPSELLLGFEVWPDEGQRAFIVGETEGFVAPLPGGQFTGAGPEATLYRGPSVGSEQAHYYRRGHGGWFRAVIADAPVEVADGEVIEFVPRPTSTGAIEGYFRVGDDWTSDYYWAQRREDRWIVEMIGESDPSFGPIYIGLDAHDRAHGLHGVESQVQEPYHQSLAVNFLGQPLEVVGDVEVRASDMQVPEPPRPELGGPAIALLRHLDTQLRLLTIEELDDWSEVDLEVDPLLVDVCEWAPTKLPEPAPDPCPPCSIAQVGVARGYGFTRTSGGHLWAVWILLDSSADVTYVEGQTFCETQDVVLSDSGTLQLREFAADGQQLRGYDVPLGELRDDGRHTVTWPVTVASFGDELAVSFATRSWAYGVEPDGAPALRVMKFDTTRID